MGKGDRSMKVIKTILHITSAALMTSVIMDTYLWLTTGYTIPSWTIAAMSAGCITLIEVIAKLIK